MEKVGTAVAWKPRHHQPDQEYESHTGVIIYNTTDGFHRVRWGDNNPDPDKFNTHRVFHPDELVKLNHHRKVCSCGNQISSCRCRDREGTKPVIVVKDGCATCKQPNPWST
jgi:hypothetical protein